MKKIIIISCIIIFGLLNILSTFLNSRELNIKTELFSRCSYIIGLGVFVLYLYYKKRWQKNSSWSEIILTTTIVFIVIISSLIGLYSFIFPQGIERAFG